MSQSQPRCDALERITPWPYVKRCKEDAAFKISSETRTELVLDPVNICKMHKDFLVQGYPDAKYEPLLSD